MHKNVYYLLFLLRTPIGDLCSDFFALHSREITVPKIIYVYGSWISHCDYFSVHLNLYTILMRFIINVIHKMFVILIVVSTKQLTKLISKILLKVFMDLNKYKVNTVATFDPTVCFRLIVGLCGHAMAQYPLFVKQQ